MPYDPNNPNQPPTGAGVGGALGGYSGDASADPTDLLIKQMAEMGISPEVLQMIGHQMGRGENLQDTPMAQGRDVGHTYVAASPLEHLANAMRKIKGSSMLAEQQQNFARQLQANQAGFQAGGKAQNNFYQQLLEDQKRRQMGAQGNGGPVPDVQQMPDVPGAFP